MIHSLAGIRHFLYSRFRYPSGLTGPPGMDGTPVQGMGAPTGLRRGPFHPFMGPSCPHGGMVCLFIPGPIRDIILKMKFWLEKCNRQDLAGPVHRLPKPGRKLNRDNPDTDPRITGMYKRNAEAATIRKTGFPVSPRSGAGVNRTGSTALFRRSISPCENKSNRYPRQTKSSVQSQRNREKW